jgi:hypothetical protein
VLNGEDASDATCRTISGAGDINGDGIDDLIMGTDEGDVPEGPSTSGLAYVVFGRSAAGASWRAALTPSGRA